MLHMTAASTTLASRVWIRKSGISMLVNISTPSQANQGFGINIMVFISLIIDFMVFPN
jgi:hypothetical protein